jgi:hypothetical protein
LIDVDQKAGDEDENKKKSCPRGRDLLL